jgi:prephenate dehydrogenase
MNRPQTIGFIGGTGRMGRLFERLLRGDGYQVLVAGRRTPLSYEELAERSDVVIVTVPIQHTAESLRRIGPRLRPEQLLSDFTSVKAEPVRLMLETPACVIGCHPVFGPLPDPAGQNVVLCPARPGPFLDWYRGWFEAHGMRVTIMDADAHDRAMGLVQGLLHFVNVTFAQSMRASGHSVDELLGVSSPIFRLFFATLGRILSGDPELYGAIQVRNAWSRQFVKDFLKRGQDLLAAVEREDEGTFHKLFDEAAAYLGEARQEARDESAWLIEHPRPRAEPAGKGPAAAHSGAPAGPGKS